MTCPSHPPTTPIPLQPGWLPHSFQLLSDLRAFALALAFTWNALPLVLLASSQPLGLSSNIRSLEGLPLLPHLPHSFPNILTLLFSFIVCNYFVYLPVYTFFVLLPFYDVSSVRAEPSMQSS